MPTYEWVEEPLGTVTQERTDAMVKKWMGRGLCRGCRHWGDEYPDLSCAAEGYKECSKMGDGPYKGNPAYGPEGFFPRGDFGCTLWEEQDAKGTACGAVDRDAGCEVAQEN